ncbi:amidohydrolase family protein [Bordetella sp. 02P26C-1]|uniref:amidohydrolase family protein n=1 Tax=Bordetella sp. 02P26C-1 TaxID=2683195 RepID=UPI001352A2EC|nr:amidohydrolase family protein [Bordetella sp. 02P26C-1]MVW79635.1 amidohydrolase family protein [Bordetella sp. 02P26C-1]
MHLPYALSALPVGACDCHAHIFGPFEQYPLATTRTYTPQESTVHDFYALLTRLGLQRGVLVQASAYGTDNRAMLAALKHCSENNRVIELRGVVVTDRTVSDDELNAWWEQGVRGLRFRHAPPSSGASHYHNTVGLEDFYALAPRMREHGFHAQLWTHASCWNDIEKGVLDTGVPVVIDHMARVDPDRDLSTQPFRSLLDALKRGDIWVKMTAYRNTSRFPGMEDMAQAMAKFVDCNPDRLLWGSDWPHINFPSEVDTQSLLMHLLGHLGGADMVKRVLVDNPAAFYGFETVG